jgi:hypothetical protein
LEWHTYYDHTYAVLQYWIELVEFGSCLRKYNWFVYRNRLNLQINNAYLYFYSLVYRYKLRCNDTCTRNELKNKNMHVTRVLSFIGYVKQTNGDSRVTFHLYITAWSTTRFCLSVLWHSFTWLHMSVRAWMATRLTPGMAMKWMSTLLILAYLLAWFVYLNILFCLFYRISYSISFIFSLSFSLLYWL